MGSDLNGWAASTVGGPGGIGSLVGRAALGLGSSSICLFEYWKLFLHTLFHRLQNAFVRMPHSLENKFAMHISRWEPFFAFAFAVEVSRGAPMKNAYRCCFHFNKEYTCRYTSSWTCLRVYLQIRPMSNSDHLNRTVARLD
jgi:hypothetical protein